MKRLLFASWLLPFLCGSAFGGDYIRFNVDSIPKGITNFEIPFYFERTCPDPELIMGIINGFVFNATGDVTWEYVDSEVDPSVQGWFMFSVLQTLAFDEVLPDTILLGGASMPPSGMPIFEDRHFFTMKMSIGSGEGVICVDSAFCFTAGVWKWSGVTCGLGGAPDRPLFLDKYGSDDNHPICVTVYDGGPHPIWDDWVRVGVDSLAAGANRAELPFYISRTCPGGVRINRVTTGFELTAVGDVTWSFSDYEVGPIMYDWFDWVVGEFTNSIDGEAPDSFCVKSWDIQGAALPVTTEELYFTLYLDIGPGVGELCIDSSFVAPDLEWEFRNLDCGLGGADERPLFLAKDSTNADHPVRITIYESMCGDMNFDWVIDIDDIVHLLQYVFGSDPVTIVPDKADVDCSGSVDVDDIVYSLDYVFGTGPEPCAACP